MNEYTLVKTVALPHGQRWAWYGDANVVGLAPCITTAAERSEALAEVYAHWLRSCIQLVPEPGDMPVMESLQPRPVPAAAR